MEILESESEEERTSKSKTFAIAESNPFNFSSFSIHNLKFSLFTKFFNTCSEVKGKKKMEFLYIESD